MAGAYIVTLPLLGGMNLKGGNDAVIVYADTAAQAKSLASAAMSNDVPAAAWSAATATELVVNTELEGWTFTINLTDNNSPFTEISVSHTATNGQVVDDVGTALAAALNATAINGATYTAGSNTLLVVAIADGMGDWNIELLAKPPASATGPSLIGFGDNTSPVSGFFGAITAPGVAGADRSTVLNATMPALYALCKVDRG